MLKYGRKRSDTQIAFQGEKMNASFAEIAVRSEVVKMMPFLARIVLPHSSFAVYESR